MQLYRDRPEARDRRDLPVGQTRRRVERKGTQKQKVLVNTEEDETCLSLMQLSQEKAVA